MSQNQSKTGARVFVGVLCVLLWIVEAIAEGFLVKHIIDLNMLPMKYFIPVVAILVVLWIISAIFLFYRKKIKYVPGVHRKPRKVIHVQNVIGMILAIVMIVVSFYGSDVVSLVNKTIDKVTQPTKVSASVGVYVLNGDSAQSLQDARNYTFGTNTTYDVANTAKTVEAIQKELGQKIAIEEYQTAFEIVDGLNNGTVGAMILNKAYLDLFTDFEEYASVPNDIRLIYEYDVTIIQSENDDTEGEETASSEQVEVKTQPVDNVTMDPFIVYLSGSDTRDRTLAVSRSDVNILAVINPNTREVLLVNTPRDYYVQISIGGGAYDKLTHCGIYGIGCSMDTLAALYNIDINYYAQINFTGFETLIDSIGGIEVESEYDFTAITGDHFNYGTNWLNGSQALAFARERYNLPGGDNDRGKNQMRVITAVINKMTSSTTLITNYSEILASMEGMFATDVSSTEIQELVKMQLDEGGGWNIHSYAVTGYNGNDYTYSMPTMANYVMYQNEASVNNASSLINRVLNGESLTDADVAPLE